MIFMMYIHVFLYFIAESTFFRKIRVSNFSISSYSMFIITVLFSSWLRFITTNERTKFFFRIFCSRFWKTKIFSAKFALPSDLRIKLDSFISAFCRTTNCFTFRQSENCNRKFIATMTSQFNLFFLKLSSTFKRTKKIFIFFCLPKLSLKNFMTKSAIDFHMQHDDTREVLCL